MDRLGAVLKANLKYRVDRITPDVILVQPIQFFNIYDLTIKYKSDAEYTVYKLPTDVQVPDHAYGRIEEYENYTDLTFIESGACVPVFPIEEPLSKSLKQQLSMHQISQAI